MLITCNELLSPTCLIFTINKPTHVWHEACSIDRQPSTGRMEEEEYGEQGAEEERETDVRQTISHVLQIGQQLLRLRSNSTESHVFDYKRQVGLIISDVLLRDRRELCASSWTTQRTACHKTAVQTVQIRLCLCGRRQAGKFCLVVLTVSVAPDIERCSPTASGG